MTLTHILNFFGSLICHQIPERTIFFGENPLPVCARDTGIYAGMFVSLLFISIKRRWKADKPPSIKFSIMLCLMTVPMMIDGASSYLGIRTSDNLLRLITGALFGIPIPLFLIIAKNFKVFQSNISPVIDSWREIAVLVTGTAILTMLIYKTIMLPWLFVSLALIITALFVYYLCALAIVSAFQILPGIYMHSLAVVIWLSSLGILFFINKFIINPIKNIYGLW